MMPQIVNEQAPVPPPPYHRAQARLGPALDLDALTLVNTLHLLTLCRLAVRLAHRRCPPPLPSGPGGSPWTYSEESLLLIALLRTLWRLFCLLYGRPKRHHVSRTHGAGGTTPLNGGLYGFTSSSPVQ